MSYSKIYHEHEHQGNDSLDTFSVKRKSSSETSCEGTDPGDDEDMCTVNISLTELRAEHLSSSLGVCADDMQSYASSVVSWQPLSVQTIGQLQQQGGHLLGHLGAARHEWMDVYRRKTAAVESNDSGSESNSVATSLVVEVQSVDEESGRYLRYGGGSESDDDDVSNATQEYVRLSVRRRKKEPSSNNSSSLPISNLYDQHGSAGEEEDGYDGDAASGYHSDGPSTAVGPLLTTNNSFPRRPGRRDFDLCTDESGSRCQSPSMTSSVSSSGFTANLLRPHSLSNKFSAPQYKTRLRIPWKQSNSTQVEFTSDSSTHSVPPSIKRSYEQLEFSRGSGSGISVCVDPSTETPGNNNKAEEAEDRDEEDRGLMIDQKEQVNSRRVRKRMNA